MAKQHGLGPDVRLIEDGRNEVLGLVAAERL